MPDSIRISAALSAYISTGITGFPVVVLDTSGSFHPKIALGCSAADQLGWFLVEHALDLGEFQSEEKEKPKEEVASKQDLADALLTLPSDEAIQLKRIADALEKIVNHLTGKVTYTYDNKFFLTKEKP